MELLSYITFDRVFGALGFSLTLYQLYKTKAAAIAAKEAAADAVAIVRGIETVTKMHEISGRSRQLLQLLRNKNLDSAENSALELCETVAKFRNDSVARLAITQASWEQAVADVTSVHDRLVTITVLNRHTLSEREALIIEATRLHTFFTGLAAQA
ncbi:MAG: hypothetical protein V4693_06010 [Pseudomonadota bacterium]